MPCLPNRAVTLQLASSPRTLASASRVASTTRNVATVITATPDDLHLPFDQLHRLDKATADAQFQNPKNIDVNVAGGVNSPAHTKFTTRQNSWVRARSDDDAVVNSNRDIPSLSIKHPASSRRSLDKDSFGTPKTGPFRDSQRASTRTNLHGAGILGTIRCARGDNVQKKESGLGVARDRLNRVSTNVRRRHAPPAKREDWQIQKDVLSTKFGTVGWSPRKRLSPDALEGIRALHAQFPEKYSTPVLADQFEVSPEAIRRILKSKWRPNEEEVANRRQRWDNRGERIWTQMVALGVKPPKKWRDVSARVQSFLQESMFILICWGAVVLFRSEKCQSRQSF
ncbi:MAG: hypothetical protein Q9228_000300 [Teloschistes exilis]